MAKDATEVGQDIGGFLGGLLSPVADAGKGFLGTTTTTTTTGIDKAEQDATRTGTIIVGIISVVVVAVVVWFLVKKA